MGSVEWRMKGQWIKNGNSAYGCPDLSGLSWAAVVDFPETLKCSSGIKYSYNNSHSTLAKVDHGPKGLVHPAS
jgi:hypothetical protein